MNIINSNDHTRDLGITMSGDCSFNEHINLRTKQCRQLTGWILRTFKSGDKCTMVALFKSLVLPRLEYGCQLWSPTSVKQINAIENIQRKFTKHITGMHSLPYENRLKHLKLYSLQRRRDRYIAIYIYMENHRRNCPKPITPHMCDKFS